MKLKNQGTCEFLQIELVHKIRTVILQDLWLIMRMQTNPDELAGKQFTCFVGIT